MSYEIPFVRVVHVAEGFCNIKSIAMLHDEQLQQIVLGLHVIYI